MNKTKWFVILLIIIYATSIFGGCAQKRPPSINNSESDNSSASNSDTTTQVEDTKRYKIALCVSHQQNDFILSFANSIKEKADELNVSLELYDAQQSIEKQAGQIESIIAQGFDGILVEPVSVSGLSSAFESAKKANIPIVTSIQRVSNQADVAAYVGTDPQEGGYLEMMACASMLGRKGNIAILYGPMGSDSNIGREAGYKKVLAQYPKIKVVASQSAYWVKADAFAIVENWLLSDVKIDAIVAQNDDMALGALKAIEDKNKVNEIKIFGIDGIPEGIKSIEEGKMMATISQNVEVIGQQSLEVLINILDGNSVKKENIVSHITITKENVAEYLN
jgi:inositol transport system substrate-binding protein